MKSAWMPMNLKGVEKKTNLAVSIRSEFREKQSFKNWKNRGPKPTGRRLVGGPLFFQFLKDCFFRNSVPRITATDCGKYAARLVFLSTPFIYLEEIQVLLASNQIQALHIFCKHVEVSLCHCGILQWTCHILQHTLKSLLLRARDLYVKDWVSLHFCCPVSHMAGGPENGSGPSGRRSRTGECKWGGSAVQQASR